MKEATLYIEEQQVCCLNCKHFHHHYTKSRSGAGEYFYPTAVGHCCYPRMKNRYVTDSCEHFATRQNGDTTCGM